MKSNQRATIETLLERNTPQREIARITGISRPKPIATAADVHPPPRAKLRPTRSLARRSRSFSTGGSSTSNSTSSAISQ